jgi:hypothetical protein
MGSSGREEIQQDFDALRTAVSRIVGHSYDALTTPERLNLLERLERETRRLRGPGHELINQLAEQAGPDELGGPLPHTLAGRGRRSGTAPRADRRGAAGAVDRDRRRPARGPDRSRSHRGDPPVFPTAAQVRPSRSTNPPEMPCVTLVTSVS